MPKGKKYGGRKRGTPNKSTETAKQVLVKFVGNNMDTMQEMFEEIKAEDPKKAFDVLMGALEYVLPKLSRVEGTQTVEFNYDEWVNSKVVGVDDEQNTGQDTTTH